MYSKMDVKKVKATWNGGSTLQPNNKSDDLAEAPTTGVASPNPRRERTERAEGKINIFYFLWIVHMLMDNFCWKLLYVLPPQ